MDDRLSCTLTTSRVFSSTSIFEHFHPPEEPFTWFRYVWNLFISTQVSVFFWHLSLSTFLFILSLDIEEFILISAVVVLEREEIMSLLFIYSCLSS